MNIKEKIEKGDLVKITNPYGTKRFLKVEKIWVDNEGNWWKISGRLTQ